MLLGLFGGCGYVVFKELRNQTLRSAAAIVDNAKLPVLGMIPDAEWLVKVKAAKENPPSKGLLGKLKEFIWKR